MKSGINDIKEQQTKIFLFDEWCLKWLNKQTHNFVLICINLKISKLINRFVLTLKLYTQNVKIPILPNISKIIVNRKELTKPSNIS